MTFPATTPQGEELLRLLAESDALEREQRLARVAFAPDIDSADEAGRRPGTPALVALAVLWLALLALVFMALRP